MKKLPEITINDWLEAEKSIKQSRYTPQPEGSYTDKQYAEATNRSQSTARGILLGLCNAGKATREKWLRPSGTMGYVYFLK